MKFRIKIFLCNIILISVAFGICGLLLIQKDFKVSLKREINQGVEQNQFIKNMIATEVKNLVLKDNYKGIKSILNLNITKYYQEKKTEIGIWQEDGDVIFGSNKYETQRKKLIQKIQDENKCYMLFERQGKQKIMVLSVFKLASQVIYIGNIEDVSGVFQSTQEQLIYYQVIILIVSAVAGVVIYMLSYFFTKSIDQLYYVSKEMEGGNYSVIAQITSKDEIGELASEFNTMARSVEEHVEKLMDYNQKQEEFIADFTHEVKTPLTSVVGYADLIQSGKLSNEESQKAACYIYREGKRLNRMSQKLFNILLLNNHEIKLRPVWLANLMEDVVESVRPQMQEKGIQIKQAYENRCVMGDYELLKTLYINLIDNARKASSQESVIQLTVKKVSRKIVTEVTDWGTGIPMEEVKKIKKAFYMVDKSKTRKEGGSGIGLSLVSKIVDLHQGKFIIKSQCGEGTTMSVSYKEGGDDEKD